MKRKKLLSGINNYSVTLFILSNLFSVFSSAQDIHFSEFYASPLLVNPAKTGFINGDYRFTAVYRSQWGSVTVPYHTVAVSSDLSITQDKNKKNIIGAGIVFFNDKAGDAQLSNTYAGLSLAYHKSIDNFQQQYLSAGISVSYTSCTIDYTGMRWNEQYKGGILTETLSANSTSYWDLSAGAEYNFLYSKNQNFSAGFAVYHLNQPVNTFFGDATSYIQRKYMLNAGVSIPMQTRLTVFPKLYFANQGPYHETIFGSLFRYNLNNSSQGYYGVYFGGFVRWNDAMIFTTRFDLNNLSMSFSYDVNYSRLAGVSHSLGGPELSLLYTGNIFKNYHKKIYCPRF